MVYKLLRFCYLQPPFREPNLLSKHSPSSLRHLRIDIGYCNSLPLLSHLERCIHGGHNPEIVSPRGVRRTEGTVGGTRKGEWVSFVYLMCGRTSRRTPPLLLLLPRDALMVGITQRLSLHVVLGERKARRRMVGGTRKGEWVSLCI